MDYENLYQILPKYPQTWSIQDVTVWLRFINLDKLVNSFQEASVDGSCITLIDDEILEHQLGIKSGIIRKKIINWTNKGLNQYSNYLDNCFKMVDESEELPILTKTETSCIRGSHIISSNFVHQSSDNSSDSIEQSMIIESFEGNNLGTHIIKKNQRISIGYDKSNDIQSLQSTFHDKHAIIGHNGQSYYIKDLGSKYGSFVKVQQRTILAIGTILEIGSFQFQVKKIDRLNRSVLLKCIMGDLDEDDDQKINQQGPFILKKSTLVVDLNQSNKFTFGRRKDNNFQRNDKHMSGLHCKIIFFDNNFYIEDFGSTNGTWIRISAENKTSAEVPLSDGSIIKIGTTVTYLCRRNQKKKQMHTQQNIDIICRACNKQQNNCLFYPCSHNILCHGCSQNVEVCLQCGLNIEQKIKIHK